MLSNSETNRLIRNAIFAFLIAILGAVILYFVTGGGDLEVIVTALTAIFSLFFVPPFVGYVERAFNSSQDAPSIVREQLQKVWIEGYLRSEERALQGSTAGSSARNPQGLIEDAPICQLQTIYEAYTNPLLDLQREPQQRTINRGGNSVTENYYSFDFTPRPDTYVQTRWAAPHGTPASPATRSPSNASHIFELHVTRDDTLITLFNQFTRIVRADNSVTGEFIVLMGERGARKTIQLLQLAEYLVERDRRVPIYLNLFSWAAGSKPFQTWLIEEIQRQYDVLKGQARKLVEGNYLILLLDGFEEVPFDRRDHLVSAIQRFLQARVDQSINSRNGINMMDADDAPVDLRDAVVIASLFPPQWHEVTREDVLTAVAEFGANGVTTIPEPDPLLYWRNTNEMLSKAAYENYLDLNWHLQRLIQVLQGLEDRTDLAHNAPVAVLRILPQEPSAVIEHLQCHFRRKVIQGQLIHHGARSLDELKAQREETLMDRIENLIEDMDIGSSRRRSTPIGYAYRLSQSLNTNGYTLAEIIEQRATQIADEAFEMLAEQPYYPQLMAVLSESPFMLRAFISTFTYRINGNPEGALFSSVIHGVPHNQATDALLDDVTSSLRMDLIRLNAHITLLIDSLNEIDNPSTADPAPLTFWNGSSLQEALDTALTNQLPGSNMFPQPNALREAFQENYETAEQLIRQMENNPLAKTQQDQLVPFYRALHVEYDCLKLLSNGATTDIEDDNILHEILEFFRERYVASQSEYRDNIRRRIIKQYVDNGLRQQPGNVGPLSKLSREDMLKLMARGMMVRHQRVLDRGDVIFYLEDIGQKLVFNNVDDDERIKKRKQYNGYVALISVIIFFAVYGSYLLFLLALGSIDSFNTQPFSAEIVLVVAVLLLFFARNFGWYSCGSIRDDNEDRARLNYPVRWYGDAGMSAGLFMGVIVGLLFFGVSEVIYSGINRDPLRFEAVMVGVFGFALFYMLGGLEMGRRFAIVAHPEDGQRFLFISTLLATGFWLLFFFAFLFWPRTRFDLLTPQQVTALLPTAITYSLVTGLFIGIVSALVFSHLYLRHLILFSYLRITNNLQITYRQVLEHNVEVGFLRRVGGGYIFRHRLIMDHFSDKERGRQYAGTS